MVAGVAGVPIDVFRTKNVLPANSMGSLGKTQHAIRRSTRLPLEVPVLVTSLDPARPFSEQCNTTLVNAHGCGLIVPSVLVNGLPVRLEIVSAKRHTTARVSEVVPLGGDPETWLVGLELDVPGNFWGSTMPLRIGRSTTRRSTRVPRLPQNSSRTIKSRRRQSRFVRIVGA